jgi:hypothetical protein
MTAQEILKRRKKTINNKFGVSGSLSAGDGNATVKWRLGMIKNHHGQLGGQLLLCAVDYSIGCTLSPA